ncbi:YmfQ family protein [Roseospirillum parvum]|uniref:Uncharacterized protein YmfQ in lambdoid prophage, DUF2313 family n=1 Tax=Roseospirillum parvum TaxID=83401 RepID=A0A1G8G1V7_9PROT|nr:putative phage tail protein [Roseospirillum parvum]SDH88206.1 Uncharacterized protein YmfQ in lambdoid prophage, DUF2313 family [Roseospirillum parvum]
MGLSADYLTQLQALLPTGSAWPRDPGATLTRLLAAAAEGLARLHARALALVEEADPRTTLELLPDWERVCGLPDTCSAGRATTIEERRAAVVGRLTARGGQSVAYFQGLAEALGYEIELTEYRPFVCGHSQAGGTHPIGPPSLRHWWSVRVLGPRVTWFRAGLGRCGVDPLAKISRAGDLECRLHKLKPAQSGLIVGYEGV